MWLPLPHLRFVLSLERIAVSAKWPRNLSAQLPVFLSLLSMGRCALQSRPLSLHLPTSRRNYTLATPARSSHWPGVRPIRRSPGRCAERATWDDRWSGGEATRLDRDAAPRPRRIDPWYRRRWGVLWLASSGEVRTGEARTMQPRKWNVYLYYKCFCMVYKINFLHCVL